MNFLPFKNAVAAQFERMQKHQMFRVDVDKDLLWETYLGSFPAGTNPMYRERTEHDCNCCKQFIRAVGNVVAVIDGEVVSIWDVKVPKEPGYEVVAKALGDLVRSKPIADGFLHYERTAGTDKNFEQLVDGGSQAWTHFFVNIKADFVGQKDRIGTLLGEQRTKRELFLRALNDISADAIETVLDLIAQNSIYRGAEHKFVVTELQKAKKAFDKAADKDVFVWTQAKVVAGSVAAVRNTAMGTLLLDLSGGRDLEAAVGAFEAMVAPTNYKRTTALVSKKMIEQAKEKLAALGLTSALERRHATIHDITINNILFADRAARKVIAGDVFDELAVAEKTPKNFDKIEEVSIDKFLTDILPRAQSMEVLVENRHAGNFVSLIAPADPTAGSLFKWSNKFSWSYAGELADSIKERVKKAGGNVTGDLCCRLAWHNYDDLDFHMVEPGGNEIYFGNKISRTTGGQLDVDMNAGGGRTREPVENIFYGDRRRMREGVYQLVVHNFCARESVDVGFEVEIDYMGAVMRFPYAKAVRHGERVVVAKFNYSHKGGFEIIESLPSTEVSKKTWGVTTQAFQKVNVMMLSPNYWDDLAVGNKHYFFMLEGCENDGTARGFFNEFLKAELDPHRKVFEMVGSKMKAAEAKDQLSGLGFSSTQKNTLVCRVKGSFTRTIKIAF